MNHSLNEMKRRFVYTSHELTKSECINGTIIDYYNVKRDGEPIQIKIESPSGCGHWTKFTLYRKLAHQTEWKYVDSWETWL